MIHTQTPEFTKTDDSCYITENFIDMNYMQALEFVKTDDSFADH